MKTITLRKPLKYEGKDIKVLNFDPDVATLAMDNEAYKKAFAELDKTIEEIKPCHLAHSYKFNYNTHADLSKFTHEQLANYTHDEIRNSSELRGGQ